MDELIKKILISKKKPEEFKDLSPSELAELVLVVLGYVKEIKTSIEAGKIKGEDGKDAKLLIPDKDYITTKTAIREMQKVVDQAVSQIQKDTNKILKSVKNGKPGKDAKITKEQIEEAGKIAYSLIKIPDFATLIQINPTVIRDSLETLQGDERLDKSAIRGLDELISELEKKIILNKSQSIGGVNRLRTLIDVDVTGATDGQALVKRGDKYVFETVSGSGSSIDLEVNGTPNVDQAKLNLVEGTNMSITDDGLGNITFDATGGGTPGGSDTQVQFNDGGAFGGDSTFTYNKTTDTLFLDKGIDFKDTDHFLRYDTGEGKLWLGAGADNKILKVTYGGASGYLQFDKFGVGEVARFDSSGNLDSNYGASFTNDVTANSFIKTGGTSSQFLKADGSVDSTTYTSNTGTVTSVSGVTNRTTITGTATINPTVDISSSYVGQNSITTLGTIGTGVWNAGAVTSTGLVTGTAFVPTSLTPPSNGMFLPTTNTLGWSINSTEELILNASTLRPNANDGLALGTTSQGWGDLFGATGFTWNIANGNWLATHSSGIMTVGTGDLRVATAGSNTASVVTVGGSQALTSKTVNGVTLTAAGSANNFLTEAGTYTAPFVLTTTGTSGAATFTGGTLNIPQYTAGGGSGTVTSVDMSVPTGLTISGNPVTTSGTLAVGLDTGYVIPLQSTIDAKAPLASPTFTGTVTTPILDITGIDTTTPPIFIAGAMINGGGRFPFYFKDNGGTNRLLIGLSDDINNDTLLNLVPGGVFRFITGGDISNTVATLNPSGDFTADGVITGSNLSGTNTGDQTITLTGDVTGSGTGSFATTISSGAVDIAMLSATGTPSASTFLRGDNTWATPAGGGTVTSVSQTVPTGFTVSGSPVTTSGTLAISYDTGYQGYTTAEATKVGHISVTQAVNLDTIESDTATNNAKVTNATHTGDATGATALTVVAINGTNLASLGTGILKNTTGTGVPSIAVAGDFPTLNQSTTGSAATLTTTRTIWGQNFNGSANVTGDITLGASNITMTGSIGATGARATKVWATDIESTNMPTVGGTSLSSTFQPLDSDLTTLAGLTATTDNFIVSVASAWASRTPAQVKTTLSLNNVENTALSTWAGTSNITTLGTVTTGTWNGGIVAGQYGGTGVANTGKTITVSGNTTIGSSTHTVAFVTGGNTSVTLPTSGTLAVLGGNTFTGLHDFGGADLEVPNGAGGTTVNATGEVCVDSTSRTFNFYDGTIEAVVNPIQSKSISIESPTASEDISMFYTDDAITVTKIVFVITGSTSATTTIRHSTDRSATGNEVVTGGTTANSTTTGNVATSFNDATIPADSFVWLETTALSGTPTSLNVTVFYRQDA